MRPRNTKTHDEIRARDRASEKLLREWYASHGLCPYCAGQHRIGKHGRYCDECYEKQLMYCLDRRDRRIEQGQCTKCGQPYFGPYTRCDECRKKVRDAAYMRRCHRHFEQRANESVQDKG